MTVLPEFRIGQDLQRLCADWVSVFKPDDVVRGHCDGLSVGSVRRTVAENSQAVVSMSDTGLSRSDRDLSGSAKSSAEANGFQPKLGFWFRVKEVGWRMFDSELAQTLIQSAFPLSVHRNAKAAIAAAYSKLSLRSERRARSLWEGTAGTVNGDECLALLRAEMERARKDRELADKRLARCREILGHEDPGSDRDVAHQDGTWGERGLRLAG